MGAVAQPFFRRPAAFFPRTVTPPSLPRVRTSPARPSTFLRAANGRYWSRFSKTGRGFPPGISKSVLPGLS